MIGTLSLLAVARTYKQELSRLLNSKVNHLLEPAFVQAHINTIEELAVWNKKRGEMACLYFWDEVYEELDKNPLKSFLPFKGFHAKTSTAFYNFVDYQRRYNSTYFDHSLAIRALKEAVIIRCRTGREPKRLIIYCPDNIHSSIIFVPIVENPKIPEDKFFLKSPLL